MRSFEELKKLGHIKKKWKLNSKYLYQYADFLNGRNKHLSIFELTDFKIINHFEANEEFEESFKINLTFCDNKSGEIKVIEQDEDRYGNFKLIDKKTREEIEIKKEEYWRLYLGLNKVFEKDIKDNYEN